MTVSHDALHDPGSSRAALRLRDIEPPPRAEIHVGDRRIRVGIAAWTEPTLVKPGVFYPQGVTSAEDRLRYYASRFMLAEVDSTYYALPARQMVELWVERTPQDFTFDVKAHALMTDHPTETKRLPKAIREALPPEQGGKARLYAKDLPPSVMDEVWHLFREALEPLHSSGKLGVVLLQYPPWFVPSRENAEALVATRERLDGLPIAVEFRHRSWLSGRMAKRTPEFLAEHDIPMVIVDAPPGMKSSLPATPLVTSRRLAILRLHGRREETWEQRNEITSERYRYLYDESELSEWVQPVLDVAAQAPETHVIFNNCYGNYAPTNAIEFAALLQEAHSHQGG
ncbi:MAG TPA: DUF72 domain-containing protein [Gemmatimonadaceae bacterium]|nr:DUF72 domain-containing protein [Gemmatimonadaceae bacterium]